MVQVHIVARIDRIRRISIFDYGIALALALFVAAPGTSPAAASDPASEADAAFEAGDPARALALYDQVLASDPDQAQALMRSGLLLSWDGRYDEAIARYDRLLAIDPDGRAAALERAKVLSWDQQYRAAARAFRSALDRWPDDTEARLGLARTLSWSGDQAAARAEYARLLEGDAGNVATLTGTAQTWAWSGRLAKARTWYERSLAASPGNRDARLGLAYARLWSGDAAAAHEIASDLAREHPADREVAELNERTLVATRPWVRTTVDRVEDTDDNELTVLAASAGAPVHSRAVVVVGVARYDMSDPTGDARIDTASVGVDLRPAPGQVLTLRVGADRLEATTGERSTEPTGSAAWVFGTDRAWRGSVTAARETLRYSPTITDAGIVVGGLRIEGSGRSGGVWRVLAGAGIADFSDGNRKEQLDLGFARRLPVRGAQVEAGIALAGMDYDEERTNGYFDPSDFRSALVVARATDTFGKRDASWAVEGSWGVQSFTLGGVDVDEDRVFLVAATAGWPLGRALRLDLHASRGDYAAQTPSGFESWQAGLRLRIAVF